MQPSILYPFIIILLTLTITTNPQPIALYPSKCTADQTQMVQTAILSCQMSSISNSSVCIRDYINKNYPKQYWNAFVKNNDANLDSVAFWYMDTCVVQLSAFGTMSRTYLVWNTEVLAKNKTQRINKIVKSYMNKENVLKNSLIDNPNQKDLRAENQHQNQIALSKQKQMTAGQCPSWKTNTVNQILLICDLPSLAHSANCIIDRIKTEMSEYWNAYVSASQTSPSDIADYYIQCPIAKPTFGANNRYVKVWRTDSIVNF